MSEFLIYQSENGKTHINAILENETVWLQQKQLADLFGKSTTTVSEHIKNIFLDGELDFPGRCRDTLRKYRVAQFPAMAVSCFLVVRKVQYATGMPAPVRCCTPSCSTKTAMRCWPTTPFWKPAAMPGATSHGKFPTAKAVSRSSPPKASAPCRRHVPQRCRCPYPLQIECC